MHKAHFLSVLLATPLLIAASYYGPSLLVCCPNASVVGQSSAPECRDRETADASATLSRGPESSGPYPVECCVREQPEFIVYENRATQSQQADKSGAQVKKPPPTRVLDDPDIQHGKISFKGGKEEIGGFLARPKTEGKYPAVLVIAGNRIGEEYIPNTCAALAKAGFVGLAPNIYHPIPENISPDSANKDLKEAYAKRALNDMQIIQAGTDFLMAADFVKGGRLGIIGFCRGGKLALLFAAKNEKIKAVVPIVFGT